MYKFSKASKEKLKTCDGRLIALLDEVIKLADFTVTCGSRSKEEQFELYKQGRELKCGTWVISDQSKVVTHVDGKTKTSKHNYYPSLAVDIAPYPIDYKDTERFYYLMGIVRGVADRLCINIRLGCDWDMDGNIRNQKFVDLPHIELKED